MRLNPKIFLLGPTASGKTELTKFCYDYFQLELVNVDSAQIYKGFNIGSAKPSAVDLKKYPHHLIDIIEPDTSYSVSRFRKDVDNIYKNDKHLLNYILFPDITIDYYKELKRADEDQMYDLQEGLGILID